MKDCCSHLPANKEMKGGGINMDRNLVLWIVIGILALLVIYAVFFKDTGTATTIAGQTAQSGYGQMVGGC